MNRLVSMAILTLTLSIPIVASAQAQESGNRMTVNFSDPSRPGLLKVSLFNGSVSVKPHTGRDVIIEGTAVSRRTPQKTPDGLTRLDTGGPGLMIEEENNVLTVTNQGPFSPGNLDIQVPAKTNLNLKTMNGGSLVVEGIEGDLEITSVNGNVTLTNVSGSVVAHATNGRLTASLREVAANKMMSFTSMNSNVDVTLPPTTKANLKIRADNGAAYSDFEIQMAPSSPPTVEDGRNRGGRFRYQTDNTVNGTINGGGPDFEIRTLNGNIYLRKAK